MNPERNFVDIEWKGQDLQDLREPGYLNIRKCNRRTLKSLSTAIMLITIPLAIEAEQKAQD